MPLIKKSYTLRWGFQLMWQKGKLRLQYKLYTNIRKGETLYRFMFSEVQDTAVT